MATPFISYRRFIRFQKFGRILFQVAFCISFFLIAMNPVVAIAQSEKLAKKIHDEVFNNHAVFPIHTYSKYTVLHLSKSQKKAAQKISSSISKWRNSKEGRKALHPGSRVLLKQKSKEYVGEFLELLTDQQKKLFRQLESREYFLRASRYIVISSKKVPTSLWITPEWMAPRLSSALKISSSQKERYYKLANEYSKSISDSNNKSELKKKNGFKNWQADLKKLLTDTQRKKYQNALGKPHKFDSKLSWIFRSGGAPFAMYIGQRGTSSFSISGPSIKPIYFLYLIDSRINGRLHPGALFFLLDQENIRDAIEISKDQHVEIQAIKRKWYQGFQMPKKIVMEVNYSRDINDEVFVSKNKNPKDRTAIEKISKVLKISQRKRLRQIWNQVVLKFGWDQVKLAHPDWQRFLELSDQQVENVKKAHKNFQNEIRQLEQQLSQFKRKAKIDHLNDCDDLLTEDQRKILRAIVGNYDVSTDPF